jgi:hypothetical protein
MNEKGRSTGVIRKGDGWWQMDVVGYLRVTVRVDPKVPEGKAADGTPLAIRVEGQDDTQAGVTTIDYYVRTQENLTTIVDDILGAIGQMNAANSGIKA